MGNLNQLAQIETKEVIIWICTRSTKSLAKQKIRMYLRQIVFGGKYSVPNVGIQTRSSTSIATVVAGVRPSFSLASIFTLLRSVPERRRNRLRERVFGGGACRSAVRLREKPGLGPRCDQRGHHRHQTWINVTSDRCRRSAVHEPADDGLVLCAHASLPLATSLQPAHVPAPRPYAAGYGELYWMTAQRSRTCGNISPQSSRSSPSSSRAPPVGTGRRWRLARPGTGPGASAGEQPVQAPAGQDGSGRGGQNVPRLGRLRRRSGTRRRDRGGQGE